MEVPVLDVDLGTVPKLQCDDGQFSVNHIADDSVVTNPVSPEARQWALQGLSAHAGIIKRCYLIKVIHDLFRDWLIQSL